LNVRTSSSSSSSSSSSCSFSSTTTSTTSTLNPELLENSHEYKVQQGCGFDDSLETLLKHVEYPL